MEERRTPGRSEKLQAVGEGIEPSSFAARREPGTRREDDLHVCPACNSDLVYPVSWEAAGETGWSVSLRCPECDWRGAGVYGQPAVDRLDEALDLGVEQLLDDLKALARANRQGEIDRFAAALDSDEILPEDF